MQKRVGVVAILLALAAGIAATAVLFFYAPILDGVSPSPDSSGGSGTTTDISFAGRDITIQAGAVQLMRIRGNTSDDGGESLPLEVIAGGGHELVLTNGDSRPVTIKLRADGAANTLGASDLTLAPDESGTVSLAAQADGVVWLSVYLPEDGVFFAASGEALAAYLASETLSGSTVVIKRDITAENLSASVPFTLWLGTRTLTVGEMTLTGTQSGRMTVVNDAETLRCGAMLIDAPLWEVEITHPPSCWNNTPAGFYIDAVSLNGAALDNTALTVSSKAQWMLLTGAARLPRMRAGMTVTLTGTWTLDGDDSEIGLPLTLVFGEGVKLEANIVFSTRQAGDVILQTEGQDAGRFTFETPLAQVRWTGSGAPDATAFLEAMNVKAYNGAEQDARMGGAGVERLTGLTMEPDGNKGLPATVAWEICGNVATLSVGYCVTDAMLRTATLTPSVTGGTASFETNGAIDLTREQTLTVTDTEGNRRGYVIRTSKRRNDLPIIRITTSSAIDSRSEYIPGMVEMEGSADGKVDGLSKRSMRIRGRGSSTWKLPKKPYRIKLDEKASLAGLSPNKDWVLLANYGDKSLVRNQLAFDIGRELTNLPFVPHAISVDVFVNGVYQGVYDLVEQLETARGRVEVQEIPDDDTGFFLEISGHDDDDVYLEDYFYINGVGSLLIRTPDTDTMPKSQFRFIQDYVAKANEAVQEGGDWQQYIDMDSLVDWFLLQELSYNMDSGMRRSCYLVKDAGGKIQFGPPWDFDLAFGNFSYDNAAYDNWSVVGAPDPYYVRINWFNKFIEDPAFIAAVQKRWREIGDKMLTAGIQSVEKSRKLLAKSQADNFMKWDILGKKVFHNTKITAALKTHSAQLDYLITFMKARKKWMDRAIAKLGT